MEETQVIEQEHNQVEYTEEGEVILVKVEALEEVEPEKKKPVCLSTASEEGEERCIFIKKNGKQCRQSGKPSQSGGPIINQYCSYHKPDIKNQ
jgi:hypothetical protein